MQGGTETKTSSKLREASNPSGGVRRLPADGAGFVAINECLQSDGGPRNVFAVGDVASCARHPRPKAGVFAVRQGAPLAANLRRQVKAPPQNPNTAS